MAKEIILERAGSQTRLAVTENGKLYEMYYERSGSEKLNGNIYLGRVMNIINGMDAAFVDIGIGKNAFLAADDADSEVSQRKSAAARIARLLHPGQLIICQVVKEPGGNKGPRISMNISLGGRYAALLPRSRYVGVSQKIEDEEERNRLYRLADEIVANGDAGLIVRTAAVGIEKEYIAEDYSSLCRMWSEICVKAAHGMQPGLICSDGSLTLRCIRDMLSADVLRVRTDDMDVYRELRQYTELFASEFIDRIRIEQTEMPLFDLLRIDHMLEDAFKRCVYLKSGGSIVIDETEAMTVIDVNTGKFSGKQSREDTFLSINCEAADEIARQMRLRDMGGIIIIDFIDMLSETNREELLQHLSAALKKDRNQTRIMGITALGLVEVTRRKLRRPLRRQLMHDCTSCNGSGQEKSYETVAYEAVRELWKRRRLGDTTEYILKTGSRIAEAIRRIRFAQGAEAVISETGSEYYGFELIPKGIQTFSAETEKSTNG